MSLADAADHWSQRLARVAEDARVPGAALGVWFDGDETLAAYGVLSTATGVAS